MSGISVRVVGSDYARDLLREVVIAAYGDDGSQISLERPLEDVDIYSGSAAPDVADLAAPLGLGTTTVYDQG
jgi:hypothetical protein